MALIIDRLFTPSLAQVAYFVADEIAGEVAVIDPRRDIDGYLAWAAERNLRIVAVLETHVHADFVSGGPELSEATSAPIYTSRLGKQTFEHVALDDGDSISVGGLKIQAYFTPGHTPEHMSYLLFDPAHGSEPVALFTGDALFVGDVGRPDLLGAAQTADLAAKLHSTVTDRFLPLPDHVIVYPGHTAGSSCGKAIGDAPDSTIGTERRNNYALQPMGRESFVDTVLKDMPIAPTYYPQLKVVNKVGSRSLDTVPDGTPLDAGAVADLLEDGALVIDTRETEEFAAGHIPGSLAIAWGSSFLEWMGWVAPYDRDLVLILDDESTFEEIRTELQRIGLDRVAGYLKGGLSAWKVDERPVETLETISVDELSRALETSEAPVLLDVRRAGEWKTSHIDGAEHVYAGSLAQGADVEIDDDRMTALICGTGYRSAVAASLLKKRGHHNLVNVTGGMDAWLERGLPVESSTR